MNRGATEHPGIVLKRRFLDPLGITPCALAQALSVPTRRVNDLVAGRRALSPSMALRLSLFFDVPARWWLEMQARFDADDPEQLTRLRSVVIPYGELADVLVTPTGVRRLDEAPAAGGPASAQVPATLLRRLRAEARRSTRQLEREPELVYFEDGRPALTGR